MMTFFMKFNELFQIFNWNNNNRKLIISNTIEYLEDAGAFISVTVWDNDIMVEHFTNISFLVDLGFEEMAESDYYYYYQDLTIDKVKSIAEKNDYHVEIYEGIQFNFN